jgi:glycopeptide antibiotics resistance protein
MDLEAADYLALGVFLIAAALCLLLWGTHRRRAALVVWTAAIIATGVPFTNLQNHTHWYKVQWIPFYSPPVKLSDIAANIIIYMPLGFLTQPWKDVRARLKRGVIAVALLSTAIETTQLYSHSRFPSSTDIACDVIGAAIGILVSVLFEGSSPAAR